MSFFDPGMRKRTLILAPTPARFGSPDPLYNAVVYIPNGPVQAFSNSARPMLRR